MKKTWKEAQVSKCIRTGNKYKFLKPFMLLFIFFIVVIDRIRIYFLTNRKRLLGVGMSFLIFLVSNSFSTPAFQTQSFLTMAESDESVEEGFENSLENDEKYLDDKVEELTQEILENGEEQYSVDEILSNSNIKQLIQNNNGSSKNGKFSKDDWNLLLVNKQHPVPEDYTFELGTIAGSMKCDARILPELFEMLQAARDDEVYLSVCSPYRDISRQEMLFNRKIKLHMGNGYSYLEAYKQYSAGIEVLVPGVKMICGSRKRSSVLVTKLHCALRDIKTFAQIENILNSESKYVPMDTRTIDNIDEQIPVDMKTFFKRHPERIFGVYTKKIRG